MRAWPRAVLRRLRRHLGRRPGLDAAWAARALQPHFRTEKTPLTGSVADRDLLSCEGSFPIWGLKRNRPPFPPRRRSTRRYLHRRAPHLPAPPRPPPRTPRKREASHHREAEDRIARAADRCSGQANLAEASKFPGCWALEPYPAGFCYRAFPLRGLGRSLLPHRTVARQQRLERSARSDQ